MAGLLRDNYLLATRGIYYSVARCLINRIDRMSLSVNKNIDKRCMTLSAD
ncbi:hypothetical protein EDWATA_00529 [Edwardsiella tarda ATCC 23685]|uniref:Uncharacterized protein n=1 Tax=Edwardsiella tarda ATCC 23685 TaxID=500638 RepID=D4F1E4_EDWTA|nr:hypothetical protein EDWATA_00529 [Edwardsiella tarda ATCC 23685]